MCLCVSLSGTTSPATTRNGASNRRYLRPRRKLENIFVFSKNALFKSYGVKMPTSLVCAYRDIIWRRWSDISPEISKKGLFWFFQRQTAGYKLPGRVRQRATIVFQPYRLFAFVRYMFVNACAFSEPRARATAPRRGFAL